MASKGDNKTNVKKAALKKAAPEKKAAPKKEAAEKAAPKISSTPGRLEGQSIEEWRKHAAHRGNVVHSGGGTSWFEHKPSAGE